MDVPLIDIYLNKKVADFETRLIESGMAKLINSFNTAIATYLYNRHPYKPLKETHPETGPTKAE